VERVAILGTGLIGGSIGLGLRSSRPGVEIIGYDHAPATGARAHERGAITTVAPDAAAAVAGADLVVLAVPLGEVEGVAAAVAAAVGADAVVTDVASAKAAVVEVGSALFGGRFIGGHPMAGSESHGIDAADADLFDDASWILTPTPETSSAAYSAASDLAVTLGSRIVAVDPAEHDALVARLSHIPQLVSSALVDVAVSAGDREALLGLAGGGFRDVTRIAASDPGLWVSILRTNRGAVLESLERVESSLEEVGTMIAAERWDDLGRWLGAARRARIELFTRPDHSEDPVALSLPVPDRPGVLAEVTTQAGRLGVNIEDLRIVHSTAGGRGRLELVVSGAGGADELAGALAALGYHVDRPGIDFST
jgi:prephenate dehydrogenase